MGRLQAQVYKFIASHKRINKRLAKLDPLIRKSFHPVATIFKCLNKSHQPIKIFKVLILIHYCHTVNILAYKPILQMLETLSAVPRHKNYIDQALCEKVIPNFILYLQKVFKFKQEQLVDGPNFLTDEQKIYKKLNLLKNSVSFINIVFQFGRYFDQKYPFIADFNVIVAKDVRKLYDDLIKLFQKNKTFLNMSLAIQLEAIHENMFVVYYNSYYYKQSRRYQPKWIETSSIKDTCLQKTSEKSTISSYEKDQGSAIEQGFDQLLSQGVNIFQPKDIETDKEGNNQGYESLDKNQDKVSTISRNTISRKRTTTGGQTKETDQKQYSKSTENRDQKRQNSSKVNEFNLQGIDNSPLEIYEKNNIIEKERQQKEIGVSPFMNIVEQQDESFEVDSKDQDQKEDFVNQQLHTQMYQTIEDLSKNSKLFWHKKLIHDFQLE